MTAMPVASNAAVSRLATAIPLAGRHIAAFSDGIGSPLGVSLSGGVNKA